MGGVYSNVFHDAVTHLIAEVRFTTLLNYENSLREVVFYL